MPVSRLSDSFGNFDLALNPGMRDAFEQAQLVAAGKAWCALLIGSFGNGKTHLAIAALRDWGDMQTGFFWKAPDFLAWIKRRAFDENEPVDELLAPYREGSFLLVLDDLGAENTTDWASEQLYRVLDSRYDLRLPTIITSNQSPDRIDGRVVSRFRSGLVVCRGEDVR